MLTFLVRPVVCAVALLAASHCAVFAQTPAPTPAPMPAPVASAANAIVLSLCDTCGVVQTLQQEKRKGKGGALGVAGGAVAGGLLGKQIGGGDGKTLATVGGAVGGALIGNEIQKKLNSKKVWVTTVKMKDGSIKTVEQEAQPAWAVGQVLKAQGAGFAKL